MIKTINYCVTCILLPIFLSGHVYSKNSVTDEADKVALKQAAKLLTDAQEADKQSKHKIMQANRLRKQLIKARAEEKNHTVTGKLSNTSSLLKQLETTQKQGAALRLEADQTKRQAAIDFENAWVKIWSNWVTNREPLTMDPLVKDYFSHNTQIRSVHKNMLNKTLPDPELVNQAASEKNMSLKIPALAQQNAPEELDIKAFKFSRKGQYFAHIEVHSAEPENTLPAKQNTVNNASAVPLNKIHQWRLIVSDLAGKPVKNAKIEIEGHMPGHVHGLPTAPQVVEEINPGVYLVDGVKFQMKGWWVMKFIFLPEGEEKQNPADTDFVIFNLVL